MRLIDADALFDIRQEARETLIFTGEHSGKTYAIYERLFRKMVENAPTVEAAPVVRCRECVHKGRIGENIVFCTNFDRDMMPDDFCSVGERKEQEE